MKARALLLFAFLIPSALSAPAREPFRLGTMTVPAGETLSGRLEVPDPEGKGTFIPVSVVHGAKPGKILALIAGTHGYEYPPILALQRIRKEIDPKSLAGTLILVHIANLPSFQRRTVYYGPADGKNLNRVFPGDSRGTLSQRIAFVLTESVIKRCDALIDMHCGDGNEALIPYSYWTISGRPDLDERAKELCLAFGLRHIIIDTTRTKDSASSVYLANTGTLLGKPAITTEAGFLGRTDEADVQRNIQGAKNVMRLLGLIEGRARPLSDPIWIDRYEVVMAGRDGLFYPKVKMGAPVKAGEAVGVLRDYWGEGAEDVRAPFAGIILYILGTPPANAGEPLFEVGRIKLAQGASPNEGPQRKDRGAIRPPAGLFSPAREGDPDADKGR